MKFFGLSVGSRKSGLNRKMRFPLGLRTIIPLTLLVSLPVSVLGGDVLTTNGYTTCLDSDTIKVTRLDATYNRDTRIVNYNVAGSSTKEQMVNASLVITAYGEEVYSKTFDPCQYNMTELCPVPATTFSSAGEQTVPEKYISQIPSIAFAIPDLDGVAKLSLMADGKDIACIQTTVGNGKSMADLPAVRYAAVGVAGAALALSAVGSIAVGGHPGAASHSPTFSEVIGWFQGMALNGMMSVQYPAVYRGFTSNFGFSTGLVPWGSMQTTIDNFRANTGGNLTQDNYEFLRHNATLIFNDGSTTSSIAKRSLSNLLLWARDGSTITLNGTTTQSGNTTAPTNTTEQTKEQHFVTGIQAYVEQLSIPKSNTFMTVLLVWCCVVAAIVVFILLLKVILEAWSIFGNIPPSMESWRKRYWWRLAKALTNLVLLLYGSWTLYCVYQFTNGDSWAAKMLAGITLGIFTAVLLFFTWKIYSKAHAYRKMDGDVSRLYEDKDTWVKYNNFYENYKKSYWWLFVPTIIYMFARGCVIAGANGHGLVQSVGQLIVESVFLIVLLWSRPFARPSGVWINISVQVVRVLSVICILVFVEELGISQTTKTITGVVLIVVQSVLTAILAILIAVNALITCIRENPHRRSRKEKEKAALGKGDLDNLTSLDARNSLLMEPRPPLGADGMYKAPLTPTLTTFGGGIGAGGRYDRVPVRGESPPRYGETFSFTRAPRFRDDDDDQAALVASAEGMGHRHDRSQSRGSVSRSPMREPTLPDTGYYGIAR